MISFSLITAVLHIVGIVVLVKSRSYLNQILIIKNLALAEMIQCLNIGSLSVWSVTKIPYMSVKVCFDLALRMFMLILVTDRFLEIYLNIKYPVMIARDRVIKVIWLIWIWSGVYGLAQGMFAANTVSSLDWSWYIHNYIVLVIGVIFTTMTIMTYCFFCSQDYSN